MKKILFYLSVAVLVAVSCNNKPAKEKKGNVQISGKAEGLEGQVVMLGRSAGRQMITIDQDSVTGDSYVLAFDAKKPEIVYLTFKNRQGNVPILVYPNEKIKLNIGKDLSKAELVQAGRDETKKFQGFMDLLREFRTKQQALESGFRNAVQKNDQETVKQLREKYYQLADEYRNKQVQMAEANKDNRVGAIILQTLAYDDQADFGKLKKIYDQFPDSVKATTYGQDAGMRIKANIATAIGAKAPDFEAPTPDGKMLKMSDVLKKSKVLILDFWASWCRPCRAENPYVVKIYKKYHDKGLNILGISLDKEGNKDKWLEAVKKDGLNWYHVSHLKFWQEPVARMYNVNSIPATFILDKNGVIRAKNLRRDKLEAKVKELLEEADK